MKKALSLVFMLMFAVGCATTTKHFSVTVDPPGALITVIPGGDEPEQKLRSPAKVAVPVPDDPNLATQGRIEVTRDSYKTKIIRLAAVEPGDVINIKLEKLVHYLLKYRMLSPIPADVIGYRDRTIAVVFTPGERNFEMKLDNLTRKPLRILWDQAEYTDYVNRRHRIMYEGIRPQDRNNAIPPEVIAPGGSVQHVIVPVDAMVYSREKKGYDTKLLFPVDSDSALALKGRTVSLFLPVEVERAIIPDYNFRIQIVDVVKE